MKEGTQIGLVVLAGIAVGYGVYRYTKLKKNNAGPSTGPGSNYFSWLFSTPVTTSTATKK